MRGIWGPFHERVIETQAMKAILLAPGRKALSQTPHFPLAEKAYANAYRPTLVTGDRKSAYNIWDLTDGVPYDNLPNFVASTYRFDQMYGNLITSATVGDKQSLTARLLNGAQRNYNDSAQATLDGVGPDWHLTLAMPGEWFEASGNEEVINGEFLPDEAQVASVWITTPARHGFDPMENEADDILKRIELFESKLQKFSARISVVSLNRPWVDFQLLSASDWYVPGAAKGTLSAIVPSIIVGLAIASDIKITTNLSAEQKETIQDKLNNKMNVTFGPFSVGANMVERNNVVSYAAAHISDNQLLLPEKYLVAWVVQSSGTWPPQEVPPKRFVVTKGESNLREEANKNARIIGVIPKQTRIELVGELDQSWVYVRWVNKTGYIARTLVEPA